MDKTYSTQDRGSQSAYAKYMASMDKVIVEKVASASVFFDPSPGNVIVDIGMASGTSTNILAHLYPKLKIIGVDINPTMIKMASESYSNDNLEFRLDDGEKLATFEKETINGFFNCSSIHHITSFNQYDSNRAFNTIKRQAELLKTGGIIVIRDFVKPEEMEVILELKSNDSSKTISDPDLLIQFSMQARSLSDIAERGFPLLELTSNDKNYRRFQLFYSDAVEFIRRKDYLEDWDVELQEEYGYFTQKEFEEIFANLGLRNIISYPIYNPWILTNRYRNKFTVFDRKQNDIGFPPTNYLIAGEKIKDKATRIKTDRFLPESDKPFLNYSSYKNSVNGHIYDVVYRSQSVVDILPFYRNNNTIEIIAKHGYPRPLVNFVNESPNIDAKHYSGYITEGITATKQQNIHEILFQRTNLKVADIKEQEKSLNYFTSPGGINEKVESVFIELNRSIEADFPIENGYSGFTDSGVIRRYDAIQLLKTAQTGALVEARLELNIYNLLRRLKIPFPQWLGEKIDIDEGEVIWITSLNHVISINEQQYTPTNQSADYLRKYRAKFSENRDVLSSNILEFVTPRNLSNNTLLALPVVKSNSEIYVGIELRNLPAPQLINGNSTIATAPAWRLKMDIKTFNDVENFIWQLDFFGAKVKKINRLGEKFFPSIGITPEQVYPYVVQLDKCSENLYWINVQEIYSNIELIEDGHLLVAIFRLINSLLL